LTNRAAISIVVAAPPPSSAQDISSRVALLQHAIETAYADPHINHSPSTMKIFMAPEFMFRGPKVVTN
jgi:hypothetical protein